MLARLLSLLVLGSYIVAAFHYDVVAPMLRVTIPILLAVACIWFPEELGEFAGSVHYRALTTASPAFLLQVVGWLVLIGLPLIILMIARHAATP